ncbi:hypothetical protein, partial [Mycobacterium tuberculosis]
NLNYFADQAIAKAHKIIIVFTPPYRYKAENRNGAAGYEYSVINTIVASNIAGKNLVVPVLRAGSPESSIPVFMQQFIHL